MGDGPEHRYRGRQRADQGALPGIAGAQALGRRSHRHGARWAHSGVTQGVRRPYEAVSFEEIARLYPPPPEYFESVFYEDRDAIERKQLRRLIEKAWRTYQVPFHRD